MLFVLGIDKSDQKRMSKECYGGCAVDVIVVRRSDGTLVSTPFHVFFGKKCANAIVDVAVNGIPVPVKMHVNERGSALWNTSTEDEKTLINAFSDASNSDYHSKKFFLSAPLLVKPTNAKVVPEISEAKSPSFCSLVESREFQDLEGSMSDCDPLQEEEEILTNKEEGPANTISPLFLQTLVREQRTQVEDDFTRHENCTNIPKEDTISDEAIWFENREHPKNSNEGVEDEGGGSKEERQDSPPPLRTEGSQTGPIAWGLRTPCAPTTADVVETSLEAFQDANMPAPSLSSPLRPSAERETEPCSSFTDGSPRLPQGAALPGEEHSHTLVETMTEGKLPVMMLNHKVDLVEEVPSAPILSDATSPPPPSDENRSRSRSVEHTSRLFPSHQQLMLMSLRYGENEVDFTISGKNRGCRAFIYLWDDTDRLIISDVDGTITKSDLLGHACELAGMGARWLHPGICSFFSEIKRNGYHVVYLTARSMYQSRSTRTFLWGLHQGRVYLPRGPLFSYPGSFFRAIRQEISKTSHVFKIHCLREIKQTFSDLANPFFAGFGNRYGDYVAYRTAGVASSRIFLLDSSSTVKLSSLHFHLKNVVDPSLLDARFPPRRHRHPMGALDPTSTTSSVGGEKGTSLRSSMSGEESRVGDQEDQLLSARVPPSSVMLCSSSDGPLDSLKHKTGEDIRSNGFHASRDPGPPSPEHASKSVSTASYGGNCSTVVSQHLPMVIPRASSASAGQRQNGEKGGEGEPSTSSIRNPLNDSQKTWEHARSTTFSMTPSSTTSYVHGIDLDVEQEFCDHIFWRVDPLWLIEKTPKKVTPRISPVSSPVETSKGKLPLANLPASSSARGQGTVTSARRFYFFGGRKGNQGRKPS